MFIIILKYKKPLEIVDKYVCEHRAFLDKCYENQFLIASGPQIPRTGGVLISQLKDRIQLENILHGDPFYINEVADYEILEFTPTKYHPEFASMCGAACS
jgi:uncharacterized protein YciI